MRKSRNEQSDDKHKSGRRERRRRGQALSGVRLFERFRRARRTPPEGQDKRNGRAGRQTLRERRGGGSREGGKRNVKKFFGKDTSIHTSIRTEIFLVFGVLSVVIIGVSLMIYQHNMKYIRQLDIEHLSITGEQLAESADSVVEDVSGLFQIQYDDLRLRRILRHSSREFNERERFLNTQYVESMLSHITANSRYIRRCCIFTETGDVYSNLSSVSDDYKTWVREVAGSAPPSQEIRYLEPRSWKIGSIWTPVVTGIKAIYNVDGVTPLAYITMDISCEELEKMIENAGRGAGTLLLYKGVRLAGGGDVRLGEADLKRVTDKAREMEENGKTQDTLTLGKAVYLVTWNKSSASGWSVVRYSSEKHLLAGVRGRRLKDMGLLLATTAVLLVICHYKIDSIVNPLIRMDRIIRSSQGGHLNWIYLTDKEKRQLGKNEIFHVIENYNEMTGRINGYMEKTILSEIRQKEAQMKMLTYQINPHFLYNTLNTISAIAEISEVDSIVQITDSISNIFRYSLKGNALASLSEELKHVQDYIKIQTYRFPGRFAVEYRIPEELQTCHILKFILQPLVENSISHGMADRTGGGRIIISARLKEGAEPEAGELSISVWDNGSGINLKRLRELNRSMEAARTGEGLSREEAGADSIGLLNVNRRVANYYGKRYGVMLDSRYGEWTKVTVKMRIKENENTDSRG